MDSSTRHRGGIRQQRDNKRQADVGVAVVTMPTTFVATSEAAARYRRGAAECRGVGAVLSAPVSIWAGTSSSAVSRLQNGFL